MDNNSDLMMPLQECVNDNDFKLNERSSSCVNLHTAKTKILAGNGSVCM